MRFLIILLFTILVCNTGLSAESKDSGGRLIPEQAAYDVQFYDLNLEIIPSTKSIEGYLTVYAEALSAISEFVLDLSQSYNISSIENVESGNSLYFVHSEGRIRIDLEKSADPGEILKIKINYNGTPKVSTRPPWDDGFVWENTESGKLFAGVACETEGADIWFPCKDHPSDEPDSVNLNFTIPDSDSLICLSNGKFIRGTDNGNGTKTFNWFVSTPINNYDITFYIAPYRKIEHQYESVSGDVFPVTFWVLPESYEKAVDHTPRFLEHIKFMEEYCGPYPFRADKYGTAEAPYLGMEHQTIIAYGFDYRLDPYFNYDWLHLHEFAHEWWGNLVTAKDWSDAWIHEGIATYMEALYIEKTQGFEKYKEYMIMHQQLDNSSALAPREELTAELAFSNAIYYDGAWVVHTLRYYLGDETFFKVLRKWAYPTEEMETVTNGSQCRLATTDDFLQIAEEVSGIELDWFFEVYLRQPLFPKIKVTEGDSKLTFEWEVQNNIEFPMPIEVVVDGERHKLPMTENYAEIQVGNNYSYSIDPDHRILMNPYQVITDVEDEIVALPSDFKLSAYPNPFNPVSNIEYSIPVNSNGLVEIKIYDSLGNEIETLVKKFQPPGSYKTEFNASGYSSGIYFIILQYGNMLLKEKIVLVK